MSNDDTQVPDMQGESTMPDTSKNDAKSSIFDAGSSAPTMPTPNPKVSGIIDVPEENAPQPEKRGRGRPKGSGTKKSATIQRGIDKEKEKRAEANAEMVAKLLDRVRYMIGGDDVPESPEARGAVVSTGKVVMLENELDLPPSLAFALAAGFYVVPAFATPKGKKGFASIWGKFQAWRALRKSKK